MEEIIKNIPLEDMEAAKCVWMACFTEDGRDFADYYFAERADPSRMLGMYVDGGLASMLCVIPRAARFGTKAARTGFITGVCTLPEFRRRGYVRRLLERANDELVSENIFASILQPFDVGFYERLGYETLAERRVVELDCSDIHNFTEDVHFNDERWDAAGCTSGRKPLHGEDGFLFAVGLAANASTSNISDEAVSEAAKIYEAYMRSRTSSFVRDESDFRALLAEYLLDGGFALCLRGAYAFGYNCGGRIECDEFAYTDADAAVRLIDRLAANGAKLSIPFPTDRCPFGDAGRTEKFNMIRVLSDKFYSEVPADALHGMKDGMAAPFSFDKY